MIFANTCLFNKTPEQCRRVGARGGRASALNRRLRRQAEPPVLPEPEFDPETAHEASTLLDERFPRLLDAFPHRATARATRAAVVELMRREDGATLEEMLATAQWDCHTAVGFLGGLRRHSAVRCVQRADGRKAYVAA